MKDFLLVSPIEGEESDLGLITHAAPRGHENLYLFVLSESYGFG